ncbi:uncharacterized protein LOC133850519 isoform X1 [Drosophila sulfurigaster albostrigata]|uniref:uncharacterized protein LOC133850519 isoform X1 n=1 Tax=Drosophila sulfurigaster albostrigata TaxID=89887 RepID=UPI002D2187DC|nr:uncharacterized protein LOC133850519 isoform X1 [Drosophila sulfurigaster albostrigata]
MLVFKKCCCCVPLRQGCIIMGYVMIFLAFHEIYWMILYTDTLYCSRLKKIWFLHNQFKILAGVLLLACAHNPQTMTFLLPLQIVVNLTSLIVELIFYLMLASNDLIGWIIAFFSFLSIGWSVYDVLVVYSFFQEMDH